MIFVYTINGKLLAQMDAPERIEQIFIPKSSKFIVTSGKDGSVSIRHIHTLKLIQKIPTKKVMSIAMSPDENYLALGQIDGTILWLCIE